jgi:pimeloyl-ACP methyl ester carboxylesterase
MTWTRRILLVAAIAGGGLVALGGCCGPQLLLSSFTPNAPFDEAHVPPGPNYHEDASWLALPSTKDEADVALPQLPATTTPKAAVFYLHSTSSVDRRWNAADIGEVRANSIRGGTLIQASAFNGCCEIYAPGYRQASGSAFVTPSPDGERAKNVAYDDVVAAFDEFVRRKGDAVPFVIVGHSQGAVYAARLLKERIVGHDEASDLVAAYVVGAPVSEADIGFKACSAKTQTGCVVAYNARGPGHVKQLMDFGSDVGEESRLCVNPVLGATGDDVVSAANHGGAVFFDAAEPTLLPNFVRSACKGGRLIVDEMGPLPDRGLPSAILLQVMGGANFHSIEFQLFYVDLRADAVARVNAFVAARGPAGH